LVGIEGLRALAAIAVLTIHTWTYSSGSFGVLNGALFSNLDQGLTLFFALSGFLLYRPFAAALLGDREMPGARAYFRNRALRIVPAYLVILLIVDLAGLAVTRQVGEVPQVGHLAIGQLVPNLLLVQNYVPSAVGTGIAPGWSLVVEVAFYLTLPVLAAAAAMIVQRGVGRVQAAFAPAMLLLVVGLAGQQWAAGMNTSEWRLAWGDSWTAVAQRSFLGSAALFSFGMAGAVLVALLERDRDQRRLRRAVRWFGPAAGLIVVAMVAVQHGRHVAPWLFSDVFALAAGLLIVWVVLPTTRTGRRRVIASWPLLQLGVISYSIYLWHAPVIYWLHMHGLLGQNGRAGFALNWLLVLTITVGLSTVTYLLVEKPALSRKRPAIRERSDPAPVELVTASAS
jgi:peptidoglycan/LPS O-acetylase OafA/YrhL